MINFTIESKLRVEANVEKTDMTLGATICMYCMKYVKCFSGADAVDSNRRGYVIENVGFLSG